MFKFKIHQLENFKFVQKACEDAMINNKMVAVIAPSGVGKTFSVQYFRENNNNVFYTQLGESVNSREMYSRILNSILGKDVRWNNSVADLIWKIRKELANMSTKSLIIIDEAGKIDKKRVKYFHELRNLTQYKCGVIICGPNYFQDEIISWVNDNVNGVEEFYSRVSYWVPLIRPTNAEIKAVFRNEGLGGNDAEKELLSSILKTPYETRSWRRIEMVIQQFFMTQDLKKLNNSEGAEKTSSKNGFKIPSNKEA